MGGIQYKGEAPRSHVEIKTITNELQEQLKSHNNRLTGNEKKWEILPSYLGET